MVGKPGGGGGHGAKVKGMARVSMWLVLGGYEHGYGHTCIW